VSEKGSMYMAPLFFTLGNRLHLMIIPDTQAHLDGQILLTYTYSIFLDIDKGNPNQSITKEYFLHLNHIKDPNYYGYITIEKPGMLPMYVADGYKELSSDEVAEIVERLNDKRNAGMM
jgi:hypothetical protein